MASTVDLPSKQERVLALDALRGLSILLMVFASSIPFGVALPSWLYHAQEPPPTNVFNPKLPGITWVDLVFPFFLFTMGAAMPIALSKRLRGRVSPWRVLPTVLWRFVLLVGFAI
jgi:predicted acyltransferase